jgi:S-adenosylmethionine decarboxylase
MSPPPTRHGIHLLADLYGIDGAWLTDCGRLEQLMRRAAGDAGAIVLNQHFHAFGAGQGVTGVILLAESHLSVHTWPEAGYAAFDIFMCGAARPAKALDTLLVVLKPAHQEIREISRG